MSHIEAASARTCGSLSARPRSSLSNFARSKLCAPETTAADLSRLVARNASQTRVLARALQRLPLFELTKKDCERRWKVGPDTVRKILRSHGVDPGPEKHLRIPFTDVLLCERILDPLSHWISASDDQRKILQADLLSFKDWQTRVADNPSLHEDSYYRHLKDGRAVSVRIGKLHRFRPDLETAIRWLASREGTSQ
ncbi:hypothetical protein [Palleronia rufa]|nr:hypothetical protein [Palleronia rufa]